MAPRSITVPLTLDAVLGALRAHAGDPIAESAVQNGVRIQMTSEGEAVRLNVYPGKTGACKVVFDRPESAGADRVMQALGGVASVPGKGKAAAVEIAPVLEDADCWLGSDESGKGDYFGPLVTVAVALRAEQWPVLRELGVRDSKSLGDTRIGELARTITGAFPCKVVTIMPTRYNELIESMRSVNRVLAWAHARAIEDVVDQAPEATAAVADQFGDASLIERALMTKGRALRLVQMPRAEADPAVAAASIVARAEFVRRLAWLGREAGVGLPKGAGSGVDQAGRAYVARHGADALRTVAKVHFKNTQRVLGGGGTPR